MKMFYFIILVSFPSFFCSQYVQKRQESSSNKLINDTTKPSTYDLLQGIWIDDYTAELHKIKFDKDSIYYIDKGGVVDKEKYFIAPECIEDKNQLNLKTKNGNYILIFSHLINDIDKCQKIDTLTSKRLVLFDNDVGKHGIYYYYYHR